MVRMQVELTANLEENSAALMTSDRGTSGGAELTLTTPVTPKTAAGLNPNATVFSLSNKTSTPNPLLDASAWDGINANDEYQHANGDIGKGEQGGAVETPIESPLSSDVSSGYIDNQAPVVTAFPTENTVVDAEDNVVNPGIVTEDQLRQMLKEQLENCFSRESLASDRYLQSQMDADQYVPIATVADLQQIQQLTNDLELITELLKELPNVQVLEVDGKCEKVRPIHNRCIVILREIPESTPLEDVKNLFSGEKCPRFVSCEFAANDSWYVTFDSDVSAQQAYQYLREEQCTFLNKPILARIKAKPLIRMTYPRNGYRPQYHQQQQAVQQQQAPPQQTGVGVTSPPAVSQADQAAQQQSQQPSQQQTQYQVQQQVPIMTPYINGQQTLPFFPNAALLQSWPTNVTSPTLLDPSMVLAINGYQATSVAKLNSGPSRHQYTNVNRNSRNQRPVRLNHEHRMHSDNRPNQDRQQGPSGGSMDRRGDNTGGGGGGGGGSHRTSPRNSDNSQISGHHSPFHREGRRGDNSNINHSHMVHSTVQQQQTQQPVTDNNSNITVNNRQSDNLSQRMTRSYRSRRRRDDDGARNMRPNSSQALPKDSKLPNDPQFDLEINSFPPLPGPGAANSSTAGDVFESKLSDVVKGTAKPQVRESKASPPPVPPPPPPPSASIQSPPVAIPKPQVPVAVTATTTSVPATTRPSSPPKSRESTTATSTTAATTNGSSGNTTSVPSSGSANCTAVASPVTRVPSPPVVPQKSVKILSMPESQPKSAESHTSQRTVSSTPKTEKPVPVQQQAQVKLTYAQMLARGREAEAAAAAAAAAAAEGGSKQRSSDESGEEDSKTTTSVRASQTLKEQSQTIKTTTANNSRPPVKDQGRREFEPKDQRYGGRRAKENRERRDRRRSERDGSRSSTK